MRALLFILIIALIAIPAMAKETAKRCKDAKTGHFVSAKYAAKHPSTTFCAAVK